MRIESLSHEHKEEIQVIFHKFMDLLTSSILNNNDLHFVYFVQPLIPLMSVTLNSTSTTNVLVRFQIKDNKIKAKLNLHPNRVYYT